MKESLVKLYQNELNYLERVGVDLAQKYPKIAHRLQLTDASNRDPHVERLIQATALLNARIRAKLEDDYPELTQSVFDLIYPHYLKPLPSHTVVSFQPSTDLSSSVSVPRGTLLEGSGNTEKASRFTTLYDVEVLPLSILTASLQSAPFDAPLVPKSNQAEAVLKLEFNCGELDIQPDQCDALKRVRIYFNAPKYIAYQLYELFFTKVETVAIAQNELDVTPSILSPEVIKSVGFDTDQAAWSYSDQSFPGYRLLSEFFVFPEKFLFIELDLSSAQGLALKSKTLSVFFYLNHAYDDIAAHISAEHFQLNATPVVNIYLQPAEPIRITHTRSHYPVVADARNREGVKVYSVESALISDGGDTLTELGRFFDFEGCADYSGRPFWHVSDHAANANDGQMDVGISLHNLPLDILSSNRHILLLDCLVTNGNLPHELWKLGKLSKMSLYEANPGIQHALVCLAIKPAIVDQDKQGRHWKLISHLNLNYLNMKNSVDASSILKEILSLYDFKKSPETRKMIDGFEVALIEAEARRIDSSSGMAFFGRGTKFLIRLNPHDFPGSSPFLFCAVLDRFLSMYTSINSFTRLEVTLAQTEEIYYSWPARSGDQCLI